MTDSTPKLTPMMTLPLEILLEITNKLEQGDLACFALCNHSLRALYIARPENPFTAYLAPRHFFFSRFDFPEGEELYRYEFLERLSRDLPRYYACMMCVKLHLWQNVDPPGCNFSKPYCVYRNHLRYGFIQPHLVPPWGTDLGKYAFSFEHLQLAMRRFYNGPTFGITTESLSYTEIKKAHHTRLMSVDARICPSSPSLCLRIQELSVVRRPIAPKLPAFPDTNFMQICAHIGRPTSNFDMLINNLISRYEKAKPKPAQRGKCLYCNTAWKMALRGLGGQQVCLALTRWIDLGPGLDPRDIRWDVHTWRATDMGLKLNKSAQVDNPRKRFERDSIEAQHPDALSEERLYQRNVGLIKHQACKILMNRFNDSFWFMHGDRSHQRAESFPPPVSERLVNRLRRLWRSLAV
ncbi:uncharacterized protein N7482_004051 [Penicillium canariense]|uniref:F-box domain-containing protein n=1 Tax=Penicillium canariense TaxID=189055 RepID=A0A9W9I9Q8_9EURO|nr:uncharacterized protein N7482_004051 [Penicillium canariense]KAJ5168457.1 hypothetical protein N7482_004051 [Penicillium canariense]